MDAMKTITRNIYVVIAASTILLASFAAVVSPSIASNDDDDDKDKTKGKVISGPSSASTSVPCSAPDVDCIAVRTVGNLEITTRILVTTYTGVLEGTAVSMQTITENTDADTTFATATGTFTGTVGDSEPGAFSMTVTLTSDRSAWRAGTGPITFEGKVVVIEGSGQGGLEGICGGGFFEGSGPPFVSTSNYEFRFGDACRSNM